jgi:two-component system chemotaxis response regulator CheY
MPKAMVVDDSKAIRMILSRTLGEVGYEVCSAGNGKEALKLLDQQQGSVSLALVDWNMPEMNGLEFVQQVRSMPRYSELTLIMVTTETEVSQMARALQEGANEYVMKPFTRDIIADKLKLLGIIE